MPEQNDMFFERLTCIGLSGAGQFADKGLHDDKFLIFIIIMHIVPTLILIIIYGLLCAVRVQSIVSSSVRV